MTRRQFGGTAADFVTNDRGDTISGGVGKVYTAQTGGSQITDLLDANGAPCTTLTASLSPKGMVQFQGPSDDTSVVWVGFGGGRVKMVASDGVVAIGNVPDLSSLYATQAQRTVLLNADTAHANLTAAHGATGAVVGTTNAQALTNKTVALGSNAVSGTRAQFNAAMTDDDFASLTGAETLTNKTLTSPVLTTPSGVARGTLGYAQVVANQTGMLTGPTDLTGLSVTVTVGTGRRIRVSVHCVVTPTLSSGTAQISVFEGATELQRSQFTYQGSGQYNTYTPAVILTPTAGAHTYKLSFASVAGTYTLAASAVQPAFILVEDIGV